MHGSEGAGETATPPRLPDQTIESKARFIEQAMAGEITARTVEDTSDVVLSAAEIKAIASGNPQIVRKVQLEAEVARLDRVRSVWLDTRRNLQIERQFAEDEIRRVEGRRAQWERASAIVVAHPHEPFGAEVASGLDAETFEPMMTRAEAGAVVRRLVREYQSAAAFQRRRLRGVVARYRGLDLVVQAHAVFAADLSLALPDGAMLDAVTAATDTGVWQSVGRTVADIPAVLDRLRARVAEAHERIATIDRELVRLEQWDGQPIYDAATSELSAINAIFAAAEEQASAERGEAAAKDGGSPPASEVPPKDPVLADVLLALTQEERAAEGWGEWTTVIPPATASLAWMSAEVERLATQPLPRLDPLAVDEPEAEETLLLTTEVGRPRTPSNTRVQFGEALAPRRVPRPEASKLVNAEAEVSQLPLF